MQAQNSWILDRLIDLYGTEVAQKVYQQLRKRKTHYAYLLSKPVSTTDERQLSEKDVILIAYGDQVCEPDIAPLETLARFCEAHIQGLVSGIHILPFFPYSSDDGFSVIDYRSVDPGLGDWEHIIRLGHSFRLMFDAVINHVSAESAWFQGFLNDDPEFRDYFIVIEGNPDLSQVVRPRALPVLTSFTTLSGRKNVWTTFSADQVDLNYRNPEVLLEILDILLFYITQGAEFIRLDAIAYLWKAIGTPCIHLPQTHAFIQLIRAVLDQVAPYVYLITETNVPHQENLSYFGDGSNEAQMVYNFALPPLVLHTFLSGNATAITQWAGSLSLPSNQVTFFNFLASHDGIGLNPVRGILSEAEIDRLVTAARQHGGLISDKQNASGTLSPYEININYFDALSDPAAPEPIELQVDRFIAAHAILLSLAGVPGIYFHSLFGSRGWPEGVVQTGRNRTINRQKLALSAFEQALTDPCSLRRRVFNRLSELLEIRSAQPAFHPCGSQCLLDVGRGVFGVMRASTGTASPVICLQNVTRQTQTINFAAIEGLDGFGLQSEWLVDLIGGNGNEPCLGPIIQMAPYQVLWLAPTLYE